MTHTPDSWRYWLPLWLARKAATTKVVYDADIRAFLVWLGEKPIPRLAAVDIEAYQQYLVDAGNRPNTVTRKVSTVCSLVTYIHRRDQALMPQNVGTAVERIKPDRRLADRILSEREVGRMFDGETNPRNLALLRVMYGAGLRISELLGLRWGNILWREADALIAVLGKGGKSRTVAIYGAARAALEAIRPAAADSGAYVFTTRCGVSTASMR